MSTRHGHAAGPTRTESAPALTLSKTHSSQTHPMNYNRTKDIIEAHHDQPPAADLATYLPRRAPIASSNHSS